MDTAAEKVVRRNDVEREHGLIQQNLHLQYQKDKKDLEDAYLADLETARAARVADLRAAGLNPNASDPRMNPQG